MWCDIADWGKALSRRSKLADGCRAEAKRSNLNSIGAIMIYFPIHAFDVAISFRCICCGRGTDGALC
jgi:hypothetical protein